MAENKGLIQGQRNAQLAQRQQKPPSTIQEYIVSMKKGIAAALPSVMTPERFTRIALSAVSSNPKLQECTPQSFLAAMMTAAQLGLEPNTPLGQAYLIPYKGKCQFQLGYKGMIDLAYRSGNVSIVQAHTVYANDKFEYELGLEPKLRHVPATGDRGDATHYYAMFRTKDGGFGFAVMDRDEVLRHARKYSQSFGNGPWQTNFDEMAKKTVLKRALKYAPLKSDFVRALAGDEAVKEEISADMADIPTIDEYEDLTTGPNGEKIDPGTGEIIDGSTGG